SLTPLRVATSRRRGSTILMVLAILALLTLMAILLTYTARQETSSARNAGIAVQNRVSALTGIDFVGTDIVISGIGSPIVESLDPDGEVRTSAASNLPDVEDRLLGDEALGYDENDARSGTP